MEVSFGKRWKEYLFLWTISYNCTACSTFQYRRSYIILFLSFSKGQLSGGDGVSYDFNMASLADHLKKQSEQGSSTYYNIDIIKYEVRVSWQEVNFFLPIQSNCSSFCFIIITLIWQTHHVKLLVALILYFSFLCMCVFVCVNIIFK